MTRDFNKQTRSQAKLRRVLLVIDELAPLRMWLAVDEVTAKVVDRLGETVSYRTIERDLYLLESLGMAEREYEQNTPGRHVRWRLRLRSSEFLQVAALGVVDRPWNALPVIRSGNSRKRLTEGQARRIKFSKEPSKVLARRYGVTEQTVNSIRSGRTWAHLKRKAG